MAGVDTSIYSQLRQPQVEMPMAQMGNALQIKNLMGAGQLQNLQLQQAQQGMEEQQKLRALFGNGTTPTAEQVSAISPTQGAAYAKTLQEQQVRQQQMLKHDDDLIKSFAAQSREELPTLTPQNWGQWRQVQMQRASMLTTPQYRDLAMKNLQKMPEQFDPNFINSTLAAGQAAPAGHTRQAGGGLSLVDPNYQQGQIDRALASRPQVTTNTTILPPQKTFENEDKLRADYTANPLVKSAAEMSTAFNMIDSAYKRPSAANDLAMATKYMKILDPTSVVRESEFALAVNATGLLDKTMNYAAAVLEGKKLNPTQRKDFYDSAKAINDAFQAERQKVDDQYSEMATGYGLNPKNVIPSLRNKPKAAAPAPAPAAQQERVIGGKTYVNVNGQWFEKGN